jgi:hypothetical protein
MTLDQRLCKHASSARQVVLRIKSLLAYGRRLGYLRFNADHGAQRSPRRGAADRL